MDRTYAEGYRELYESHWWWRARERLITEMVADLCPPGGFGQILDIGCGDGLFFDVLRRFGLPEGVEPDEHIVTATGRRKGTIYVRPFEPSFDPGKRYGLILMLDVLEHLDNDLEALIHVRSLLAPGGRLILTVPASQALWTNHDVMNQHRRRYTHQGLERVAREAGLSVSFLSYYFVWLAPLKLLVRLKERLFRSEPVPASVPIAPLNHTFYAISRLEQKTWGRLRLPFGSSLRAVFESP